MTIIRFQSQNDCSYSRIREYNSLSEMAVDGFSQIWILFEACAISDITLHGVQNGRGDHDDELFVRKVESSVKSTEDQAGL